jgi:ABC-type metal ion transport system substrate-binding protein
MKKIFELVVGEDVLPFFAYDCNQDGTAVNPYMEDKIYAFENNARVVEVTDLNYVPQKMSVYSEESNTFTNLDNSENITIPDSLDGTFRFVYLVGETVYGNSILRQDDSGPMSALIAALQSNPTIRLSGTE